MRVLYPYSFCIHFFLIISICTLVGFLLNILYEFLNQLNKKVKLKYLSKLKVELLSSWQKLKVIQLDLNMKNKTSFFLLNSFKESVNFYLI